MSVFKRKFFWIGLVAVVMLYFVLDYSSHEQNAAQNIVNCQNVKLEMSIEDVVSIMGKPESSRSLKKPIAGKGIEDVFKYHYASTLGASSGVDIYFSPETMRVIRIDCQ